MALSKKGPDRIVEAIEANSIFTGSAEFIFRFDSEQVCQESIHCVAALF